MKVRVRFTQQSVFVADLDYEQIAEAITQDIAEGTGDFEEVPVVPASGEMTLPVRLQLGKSAGGALDTLLADNGYEADASVSFVESMEEA